MSAIPFTYDNQFAEHLPADPSSDNRPRQVPGASYSSVMPTPVSNPELVAYSKEVAETLGLQKTWIESDDFLHIMAGNRVPNGMKPFAMNYAGHQFGNWAGQLGDGRAINLAEILAPDHQHWTLQLKGAGPTPYSRTADGRAVLRSSIREFLCSEAMHHLGVPTTRALSLVLTGDSVLRDMFYDGNAAYEPGAIVCRVAPSFVRFGNFQVHVARQELDILSQLLDHCISRDFTHLSPSFPKSSFEGLRDTPLEAKKDLYIAWFKDVLDRTLTLVVHWMRVGFVHGVLNTDNMSILGQTIDYGPYGWIDNYDLDWTPNTTDAQSRRYVFGNQPAVVHWNLAQLARSIVPLVGGTTELQDILATFPVLYQQRYQEMMAAKLGFRSFNADTDTELFAQLGNLFAHSEIDMTLFYRQLALIDPKNALSHAAATLKTAFYGPIQPALPDLNKWIEGWSNRLVQDIGSSNKQGQSWNWDAIQRQMNAVNPKYVLRNYIAQQAIDKAYSGDYSMVNELLDVLKNPYDEQPQYQSYYAKRPDWARQKAGSSMLSCSS